MAFQPWLVVEVLTFHGVTNLLSIGKIIGKYNLFVTEVSTVNLKMVTIAKIKIKYFEQTT